MRNAMLEVLDLQRQWNARNTPEMEQRGKLIRDTIPQWLREIEPRLKRTLGPAGDDLFIEGRDATGHKSQIPWVRIASRARSPNARTGWYVVILVHALGDGFYFWLGQGSTKLAGKTYIPRDPAEIDNELDWARSVLADKLLHPRLLNTIDLGGNSDLAEAYARSVLASFWYKSSDVPGESALSDDLDFLVSLLRVLYDAQDLGRAPATDAPDIGAAVVAARAISEGRGGGQGYGLTPEERKAVERHAMDVAHRTLTDEGYEIEDVSAKASVDYIARRGVETLFVEVKGSTSPFGAVLLTANEVEFHRTNHPNNALMIVHSIDLARERRPTASGGTLVRLQPWMPEDDRLAAIAYRYRPDEPS